MCGNYYKKQHQLGIMSAADYVIKQALWIFKKEMGDGGSYVCNSKCRNYFFKMQED